MLFLLLEQERTHPLGIQTGSSSLPWAGRSEDLLCASPLSVQEGEDPGTPGVPPLILECTSIH